MPRAGLTRDRVVREAAAVADEVGYPQLTLAAVAERFGVAVPSLYKHVDGLEGLRRDLAVHGMRELAATLSRAAVGRTRGDALEAVADAYRRFAHDHPGLYDATLRAPRADDAEHTAVSADALAVSLAVMRSYGIEGTEAVHGIRMFRSAGHGFVSQEAAGSFGLPESIDESYRVMIAALDGVFSHWGRAS